MTRTVVGAVGGWLSGLGARRGGYLLALLGPLVLYTVALKVIRVLTQFNVPGFWGFVDQVRSDVLMVAAFAIAWVGVLATVRRRWSRAAAMAVMHCTTLAVALWASMAHLFYMKTGSPLDIPMMKVAWATRAEIDGLLAAELNSRGYGWWLVLLVAYCTVGPVLVTALLRRLRSGRPDPSARFRPDPSARPDPSPRVRTFLPPALTAAALSVALVLLAALPGNTAASFARDPLLNAVMAPMEARRFTDPPDVVLPTADQLPTRASLTTTPQTRRRNVVMVFLESVRAMSTTLADPDLATTPFLAELAKTSLVAENAYAVVPHSSKALVAAHCGVAPPLDMVTTEAQDRGIYARCLPQLLADQGYRTAFFQSATQRYENRPGLVANLGYTDFFPVDTMPKKGFSRANYFGWEDDIMLEPSRSWLKQGTQPFMATYLTVTSHHDYVVPPSIDTEQLAEDPEVNRYLNTIRYQDRFLKRLFDQYRKLGLYQNTVFVIVGDHGEGFGEHGLKQHDNTIYNEGVHVPLLVHDPARLRARTVQAPVQSTALLATVAEMLGYRIVHEGYAPSLLARTHSPVRIACYVDDRCMAAVQGDGKFVFHFGQRPDEFFDLSTDPGERHNILAKQDRSKVAALRTDLLRWRAEVRGMTALGRS